MGKSLTCCTHTWRLVFIVLNVIFTIIGLAMVGVGIWLVVDGSDFDFITESIIASPAALLIVAGVITVVISVVGIIGAVGMWYCVLIVYISIMALVVVLQITAGILGAVFRENLREIVEERFSEAIDDFSVNDTSSDVNQFIDTIQEEFECCGYSGPSNWLNSTFSEESSRMFPESCACSMMDCDVCAPFGMTCNASLAGSNGTEFVWTQGCNSSITDKLEENLGIIAGVGVAFGIFEISGVAIALGLCICSCMKRKDDDFPADDYVY